MKKIFGFLAMCSVALFVSTPSHALVTVAAGGGADHTTIQAGLDAAAVGEEVQVTDSGTYAESLNINGEVLTSVPAGATIDAGGANGVTVWGTPTATIDGFTITNAASGVNVDGATTGLTIANCTIDVNNHGVLFNNAEDAVVTINGCTITSAAEHGVTMFRSATVNINDSFITNCGNRGIYIDGAESTATGRVITMVNTEITNNTDRGIVSARDNLTITATNCKINGNGTQALCIDWGPNSDTYHFTFTNTEIKDNGTCISSHRKCQMTFNGCTITGNGAGTGDGNWAGGFFLDGDSAGSTLTFNNTTLSNNVNRGLFTGRPITLNMDGCTVEGNGGWGVLVDDYTGVDSGSIVQTITNTSFLNNGGIGLYLLARESNTIATVTDCTFQGGSTDLASEANLSNSGKTILATIQRNKFLDGSGNGAGMLDVSHLGAGSTIVNNLFEQSGTALRVINSEVDIAHNTFVGTADGNGINISNSANKTVNVVNNIIAGYDTGIVSLYNIPDDDPDVGNIPGTGLDNVTVDNNMVQAVTAELDVTIAALAGGANILGISPDFMAASATVGAGNYHLNASSPALGKGLEVGTTDDLDKGPRPLPAGTAPDLGAFEHVDVPVELSSFMID